MEPSEYKFTILHELQWDNEKIGRFDIFLPQHDCGRNEVEDYYSFVKLTLRKEEAVLKLNQRSNRLCQASIHPSVFPKQDLAGIKMEAASEKEWVQYKAKQIKFWESGWPALILGILGIVIDGSFAIGKAKESYIVFHLNDFWMLFWMILALVLKGVALYLLFKKTIKEAK